MKNFSAFQMGILAAFGLFAVFGVVMFSGNQGGSSDPNALAGKVVLWAPFDMGDVSQTLDNFTASIGGGVTIKYVEKNPDQLVADLAEAIASGESPDMLLYPSDVLYRVKNKLEPIPYETISARTFKDMYIDSAELLLGEGGAYGIPVAVDPLVMYWNKDIFSDAGVASYPKTWEELMSAAPLLTKKDERGNILRSAVSLGGSKNIQNSKEILSAMFLQLGDPITTLDASGLRGVLGVERRENGSAASALRYYTEFGNPSMDNYTWNTSLDQSRSAFGENKLAIYFGMASEMPLVLKENPHLRFDISQFPQRATSNRKTTFGRTYILSVVKGSADKMLGLNVLLAMARGSESVLSRFAKSVSLPSAERAMLVATPENPNTDIINKSALSSLTWIDPDAAGTSKIFSTMIDSVLSGVSSEETALKEGNDAINSIILSK